MTSLISLGVRNRENDDDRQPSYRSQSSRPVSPSKRFSSPRPFLLPRTPKRADVRLTLVGSTSQCFEARGTHADDLIPVRPFTPTPLSPENTYCFRTPSPRQLARRRRRRPGSPRSDFGTPTLLRSVLTPTTLEEGKPWKVFNEDEEIPVISESPNRIPSPTTSHFRPSTQPASPHYYPTTFRNARASCTGAGPPYRPFSTHSKVIAHQGSPHSGDSRIESGLRISDICDRLIHVFNDLDKYERFVSHKGCVAQYLLNLLKTLLDRFRLSERCRTKFFQALLRLSRKSELVPDGLFLTNVLVEREGPITDGHFGEIYRGHFRGKPVCLKVVKMYQKSDQHIPLKAFSREAVLWSQLAHINVLPFIGIYRIGDKRDRIGLVSPWMDYGDVNEYIRNHPGADRQLLVSDIATGILYLHNCGVIHGDLKGCNILVTASHRACLADFGLSSVVDSQGLKTPALSSGDPKGGTVRFQAPELNDPNIVNLRSQASDIYAFAFVCYEIFTGNYPFPHIFNHWAVIMKVVEGERPLRPVGSLYFDRGLTDHMWALMQDCWVHDPAHRPTASEIVHKRLLPKLDPRPLEGRGDEFLGFHGLEDKEQSKTLEASVADTLRALENIGI
ncbi:kinase-like domain-containing protein [Collybia nuda]|uniref:Kinase-like domain-containing protein n=1 Tax=Collybia nuda TaxID=64659 RepID=A0A9P5XU23_9AGAR|nr:kinase-like domain-containing protein [Collybia nuda]